MSFGEELCKIVGVNPWKVARITLDVVPDATPVARVELQLTPAEERAVKRALKRYAIVELPEEEPTG